MSYLVFRPMDRIYLDASSDSVPKSGINVKLKTTDFETCYKSLNNTHVLMSKGIDIEFD